MFPLATPITLNSKGKGEPVKKDQTCRIPSELGKVLMYTSSIFSRITCSAIPINPEQKNE
jgi:hypothetical protein